MTVSILARALLNRGTARAALLTAAMVLASTLPVGSASPSPSPTAPSTSPGPSATGASPSAAATGASFSPAGSASPMPSMPPAERCSRGDIIGAGAGTTGGAGGRVAEVQTPRELVQALELGRRPLKVVISVTEPEVWTVGKVSIDDGDLTVTGSPDVIFRGSQFQVRASNVYLRNLYSGTGDETLDAAEAADFEPFTINGFLRPVTNVVLQCVVGIWGPDIGGLAVLGDASNVTVQDSIFGEGLYLSKHPEATPQREGHSHGVNLTRGETQHMLSNVTIARNLIARSEGRMPKITGGRRMELVNNLIVGWGSRAPEGNAESVNVVGNYLIPSDRSTELLVWSPRAQSADPRFYGDSVWLDGNVLEGHGRDELRGPPRRVYRESPAFPATLEALTAEEARDHVITYAGGPERPAWAQRVVEEALSGVADWYNGDGYPAPNPAW